MKSKTAARRARTAGVAVALLVSALLVGCDRRQESTAKGTPAAPASVSNVRGAAMAPSAANSASGAPSALPSGRCITPESVGALPFAQLTGETGQETAALAAAGRELKRVLEMPADYFATVQTAGDLVLLELWHRSAFLPDTCAVAAKPGEQAGNGCAKCRTFAYDPRLGRIVSTKVWEQAESEPSPRR